MNRRSGHIRILKSPILSPHGSHMPRMLGGSSSREAEYHSTIARQTQTNHRHHRQTTSCRYFVYLKYNLQVFCAHERRIPSRTKTQNTCTGPSRHFSPASSAYICTCFTCTVYRTLSYPSSGPHITTCFTCTASLESDSLKALQVKHRQLRQIHSHM